MDINGFDFRADPAQEAAICHGRGPCAVIAGPGSGKTHVLVQRIRYLVQALGVPASSVLVLTFSRAAAMQMRRRYMQNHPTIGMDVTFGTFHAVFYRILQESSSEKLRLIDAADKQKYLGHLCRLTRRQAIQWKVPPPQNLSAEELQQQFSRCKNGLPCEEAWVPALLDEYDAYLRGRGQIDFDDMILRCLDLFGSRPDILARWQDRFRWILVDEFQDVSSGQYRLLRLLAAPQDNLFVVGDDDQSIYGFRGAAPGSMRQFLKDYGDKAIGGEKASSLSPPMAAVRRLHDGNQDAGQAKALFLTRNYRCGRSILGAAAAVIAQNRDRIVKDFRPGTGQKGAFRCRPFTDRQSQFSFLAAELARLSPGERGQAAVIFRTHWDARRFLPFLEDRGVHYVAAGTKGRAQAKTPEENILRDIAAYYRASSDLAAGGPFEASCHSRAAGGTGENSGFPARHVSTPRQREAGAAREDLLRIMNRPQRFLSGSFAFRDRMGRQDILDHAGICGEALADLLQDLSVLDALPPRFSLRYLLQSVGYRAFAEAAYPGAGAFLDTLTAEAKDCPHAAAWLQRLDFLLEEGGRGRKEAPFPPHGGAAPDPGPAAPKKEACIQVLTMHACKGLEFDAVFIPDLNEGILPQKRAWTAAQIEEERRLLYVAMTRARRSLTLLYLEGAMDKPAAPSRFLQPFL